MKQVVVHPERCVGCMQCMLACAVAHSKSKNLYGAMLESPRPRSRIHVGVGAGYAGFPNRCRHCNPAPCLTGCLPGAIFWAQDIETVLIDPDKCINCGSCAMACPYGVLRFHCDFAAPPNKKVAVKCDNCYERQSKGLIPACVETCKVGALTFEELDTALKRKTDEVSHSIIQSAKEDASFSKSYSLLKIAKAGQSELRHREVSLGGSTK
ncbi:MAG: 4Fe-4S dicluster domain-containing protein [Desulfomonilaceae bacterium]